MKKINMIGHKYSKLLVLSELGRNKCGNIVYSYICDCGNNGVATGASIRRTKSCGCSRKKPITHGMSKTRTYKIWVAMKRRCTNKTLKEYKYYGGAGISVCEKWSDSFIAFLQDMGEAPKNMSIDRINNSKGYSKSNCRWATDKEQSRNKTTTRNITFNGETKTLTDWALSIGTSPAALHYRIVTMKMPVDKALTVPFTRSNSIRKFL